MPKKKAAASKKEKKEDKGTLTIHSPFVAARKVKYVKENVPDQFVFYVCDGKVLKNLKDLIVALDKITDDVFSYHSNKEKNDFSNWIRDIINEPVLAKIIAGKNRHSTKIEIVNFLKKRNSL